MSFSGSYRSGDVSFLLKPLPLCDFVDVAEKEALIQSGRRHYSEMLSPEALPSTRYLQVFREACEANLERMALDCLRLAALIAQRAGADGSANAGAPVTLVSLARAGTPVGVVLKHLLGRLFGRTASHYSVSIIRDRGIDRVALEHILAQGHAPGSIVFVDGWTGKGVISRELAAAVALFNSERGTAIDGGLYVLSDLAGTAACAASCDDYLIPSSILNATVSGLVSRSILNDAIGPGDFHGCVYYGQFEAHDQSQAFADELVARALALAGAPGSAAGVPVMPVDKQQAGATSRAFMQAALERHGITDPNLVKPGIGEATRVLLRRSPRLLIVRDAGAPEVAHLLLLAQEKNVPVIVEPALPYFAVSLIRSALDG